VIEKGTDHPFQRSKNSEGEDVIVLKGDGGHGEDLAINLNNIKASLSRLYKHRHSFIKDLKGDLHTEFRGMVDIIHILYSSAAYDHLHEIIVKVFGEVNEVTPGTIGAYFAGCLVRTDFADNPGCSAVCAGAVPRGKGTPGWELCGKLAILYDAHGSFTTLNNVDDKREAYIYIPEGVHFERFKSAELDALRGHGVEKAKIVRYSRDGRAYHEISGQFTELGSVSTHSSNQDQSSSSAAFWVIALPLIILILIALGWYAYSYYR